MQFYSKRHLSHRAIQVDESTPPDALDRLRRIEMYPAPLRGLLGGHRPSAGPGRPCTAGSGAGGIAGLPRRAAGRATRDANGRAPSSLSGTSAGNTPSWARRGCASCSRLSELAGSSRRDRLGTTRLPPRTDHAEAAPRLLRRHAPPLRHARLRPARSRSTTCLSRDGQTLGIPRRLPGRQAHVLPRLLPRHRPQRPPILEALAEGSSPSSTAAPSSWPSETACRDLPTLRLPPRSKLNGCVERANDSSRTESLLRRTHRRRGCARPRQIPTLLVRPHMSLDWKTLSSTFLLPWDSPPSLISASTIALTERFAKIEWVLNELELRKGRRSFRP